MLHNELYKQSELKAHTPFDVMLVNLKTFPIHWHRFIEIVYVLDGKITATINNEQFKMDKGDFLLINSSDIHSFIVDNNENRVCIVHFNTEILTDGWLELTKNRVLTVFNKQRYIKNGDPINHKISLNLNRIIIEFKNKQTGYKASIYSSILEIFLIYLRLEKCGGYLQEIPEVDRLRNVIDFVSDNFQNKISLEDAAKAACYSPYHFSRLFKKQTKQTFFQYLKTYRINYAIYLLITTDKSITEISYNCGYDNIKTFIRHFNQIESKSPSIYRKTYKISNI